MYHPLFSNVSTVFWFIDNLVIIIYIYNVCSSVVNRFTEVKTPPFAESITEGDVQWQKGVSKAVHEYFLH